MIKKDIATKVYEKTTCRRKDAGRLTDFVFSTMRQALENGEDIFVRGFGTFKIVTRKAKLARNINTGAKIIVPERKEIKFIAARDLAAVIKNVSVKKKN